MKLTHRLLSTLVAAAILVTTASVFAESCCVTAKSKGKDCDHKCCVEARKNKKTCDKCQATPSCCDTAIAKGKECEHKCCKEAAKDKKVCQSCNKKKDSDPKKPAK